MYLRFHSVKEPSKNHDIWVRVLFGSWQNLGSGSVRSCWFRVLSQLYHCTAKAGSGRRYPKPVRRRAILSRISSAMTIGSRRPPIGHVCPARRRSAGSVLDFFRYGRTPTHIPRSQIGPVGPTLPASHLSTRSFYTFIASGSNKPNSDRCTTE